jgi:hypothetical protein
VADFSGVKPAFSGTGTGSVSIWSRNSSGWLIGPAATTDAWEYLNQDLVSLPGAGQTAVGPIAGWNSAITHNITSWTSLPSDFGDIDTLQVNFSWTEGPYSDDNRSLTARFFNPAGTTPYSNSFNIRIGSSSAAATESYNYDQNVAVTLTAAGLAASKSDWEGALLQLTWSESRSMGADGGKLLLVDINLSGTYTSSGPPTVNATLAGSWGGWTGSSTAVVMHAATLAASWGGWTGAMAPSSATLAADWGAWTGASTALVTHHADLDASWGAWTGALVAGREVFATLAAPWGDLTAAAAATVTHHATAAGSWGAWTTSSSPTVVHPAALAATWGSWTSSLTPSTAFLDAAWGGWTGAATPTVEHPATFAASWDGWTGDLAATRTHFISSASSDWSLSGFFAEAAFMVIPAGGGTTEFTGFADWSLAGIYGELNPVVIHHVSGFADWSQPLLAHGDFTSAEADGPWGGWTGAATFSTSPIIAFSAAADWDGWTASVGRITTRPFRNVQNGWSEQPPSAADSWQNVDDSPDSPDLSDYIYASGAGVLTEEYEVGPLDAIIPIPLVTRYKIRAYVERIAGTGNSTFQARLGFIGSNVTLIPNGNTAFSAQVVEGEITITNSAITPIGPNAAALILTYTGATSGAEIRVYAIEVEVDYVSTDAIFTANGIGSGSRTSPWATFTATMVAGRQVAATLAAAWGGWSATTTATVEHPATLAADWGAWSATFTAAQATFATLWGGWTASSTAGITHPASLTVDWGGWAAAAIAGITHPIVHEVTPTATWGEWRSYIANNIIVTHVVQQMWAPWGGGWNSTLTAGVTHPITATADWGAWSASLAAGPERAATLAADWGVWTAQALDYTVDLQPVASPSGNWILEPGSTPFFGFQRIDDDPDNPDLSDYLYSDAINQTFQQSIFIENVTGTSYSWKIRVYAERQGGGDVAQELRVGWFGDPDVVVIASGTSAVGPALFEVSGTFGTPVPRLRDETLRLVYSSGTGTDANQLRIYALDVEVTHDGFFVDHPATLDATWGALTITGEFTVTGVHDDVELHAAWGALSSHIVSDVTHFVDDARAEWGTWDGHLQGPGRRRKVKKTKLWAETQPQLPGPRGVKA